MSGRPILSALLGLGQCIPLSILTSGMPGLRAGIPGVITWKWANAPFAIAPDGAMRLVINTDSNSLTRVNPAGVSILIETPAGVIARATWPHLRRPPRCHWG